MKGVFLFFMLLSLTGIYSCNRDTGGDSDEIIIERQEDYNREDAVEKRSLPVETDDEVELDRDVLGDDEVEIDD